MENVLKMNNNPWKGLQSYQENDIIYGRDEEIKALYTRILYNTQTVVYGKSGIGKSSIINAGIIPRAKYDGMLPISIRLAHTTKKGQTETAPYVEQIFNRIKEEIDKAGYVLEEITPHIIDHEETIWELLHRFRIWEGKGDGRKRIIPLLIFDQFEELFTLEISNKRVESFFSELADLLNDIKPIYLTSSVFSNNTIFTAHHENDDTPKSNNVFSNIANRKRQTLPEYLERNDFHIVITLREDFLSYLERYTIHIPVMKQNRFPILPLNEEQAAKIITEPIKNLIGLDVADIIIKKVTGRNDFKLDGIPEIEVNAALLSLYMEQLYERKSEDVSRISSELVMQCGDDIIKNFYERSIEDINAIDIIEDELITNADKRDNVARINLVSKGVTEEDLDKLIDRKVLRQFSYDDDFRIEFIHDILCPIVNSRIEHREQLAKEKEARRIEEENKEIKRQNDRLNKIRSLFLSEKAISCNRDRYLAQLLALEALPIDIEHPDKPLVPQAERALRKSVRIPYCPMVGHKDIVTRVMFTPEGTHVLSSSHDGLICLWDVFSGVLLKEFNCGESTIITISVRDDGDKMAITNFNDNVQLYSLDNSKTIDEFSLDGALPTALAISCDGTKIAIGLKGGNVKLYFMKQEKIHKLSNIKKTDILMFSPDGEELIAIGDGSLDYCSVKTWEWDSLDKDNIYAISCVSYSRNGKYLFCGTENGKIIIFENCSGKRQKKDIIECENTGRGINAISISYDTKKIVYSVGGKLIILECDPRFGWSPQKAKEQGTVYQTIKTYLLNDEFDPIVTSVAWSPDDRYVVWGNTEGLVSLYDTKSNLPQLLLKKAASYMKALEYSPNGEKISCLSNHNTFRIIEIGSGTLVYKEYHANQYTIGKEQLSADGKYRAVCNKARNILELYESNKLTAKYTFAYEGEATSISFNSDSTLLALATNNGNVTCWDINNGENIYNLNGNMSMFNTVLFSPKGKIVATTAPNRAVIIRDEKSGIPNYVIASDKGFVFAIAFSPDGERLAIGMDTGVIRIWNVSTKEQVDVLENWDGGSVRCMSFSPDGERLSASYNDGSVVEWACPSLKALLSDMRQKMILRKFTDDERKTYYLD